MNVCPYIFRKYSSEGIELHLSILSFKLLILFPMKICWFVSNENYRIIPVLRF